MKRIERVATAYSVKMKVEKETNERTKNIVEKPINSGSNGNGKR